MGFSKKTIKRIIMLTLLLLLLIVDGLVLASSVSNEDEVNSRENILIVHSYNQGFSWTDELHRGITEKLSDQKYNIYPEYLDAYRENPLDQHKIETIKNYATKDIDYIVATDNTAFELMLSLKKEYFPNTPILFAGVNGGIPAEMPFNDVTGILQNVDYQEFLLWLNQAMPQTQNLLLCGADTNTTKGTYEQLMAAYKNLADENLHFQIQLIKIDEYNEQIDAIKTYDPSTTALYSAGSFGVLNHDQYTDMLATNSNRPTFCGVSTSITNQVIGGFVVSPYEHGQIIGDEIVALSNGKDIQLIPIIEKPVQEKIFNHNGMEKFNLTDSDLPPNSTIINKPEDSYVLTYNQILLIVTIIVVLIVVISAQVIVMKIRRKAHDALARANAELSQNEMELEKKSKK